MLDDELLLLLRDAEWKRLHFVFVDGEEMLAEVVSATHVGEDDSVMLLRVGAFPEECGWQVWLADIRSVSAPDRR